MLLVYIIASGDRYRSYHANMECISCLITMKAHFARVNGCIYHSEVIATVVMFLITIAMLIVGSSYYRIPKKSIM